MMTKGFYHKYELNVKLGKYFTLLLARYTVIGCLCLILVGAWANPIAAQIEAKASVDSSSILIGDQITLRIEVSHRPNVSVNAIDISALELEPKIEILTNGPLDTIFDKGDYLLRKELRITSFDSGYHWIPEIPVNYAIQGGKSDVVKTMRVPLEVRTFPIETDTVALQPIKDIIEEPINFMDILPYLAGGVGMFGILLAIWWFFIRKKEEEEIVVEEVDMRPAHVISLEKLELLRRKKLWQSGQIKAFHTELTYIFREYLERRFEIRALESTSDEIILGLKSQSKQPISSDWFNKIMRLLNIADLVKFAKAEPPIQTHEEMLDLTEQFILNTKVKELPIAENENAEGEHEASDTAEKQPD